MFFKNMFQQNLQFKLQSAEFGVNSVDKMLVNCKNKRKHDNNRILQRKL